MQQMDNNEIRSFPCSRCHKPKLVLKKVWNQPNHGFVCDECCGATTDPRSRCSKCLMQ